MMQYVKRGHFLMFSQYILTDAATSWVPRGCRMRFVRSYPNCTIMLFLSTHTSTQQ